MLGKTEGRYNAMVTRCYACKGQMHSEQKDYHYTECGLQHVNLKNLTVFVCEQCGAEMPEITGVASLHFAIAADLLKKKGPLCGEEIRFLRKVAGLKATELATFMEVDSTTISKWETGARPMGRKSDRVLRLIMYTGILQRLVMRTEPDMVGTVANVAKSHPSLDIRDFFKRMEGKRAPKRIDIDPRNLAGFGLNSNLEKDDGLLTGAVN
jgi:putative zinc finger/helix-turn-helix YgiT family protein